jgi:hypothetical protein
VNWPPTQDEELCMPKILLVRSPFARTPKQEPNDKMIRNTQCKHQRYIKAFTDVGSKSIQIKNNLGNHLHGDADLVSIVEVAISIQLVRRAVFPKKQSILRRFQRSKRGTLLKLTKMVMLLWMSGQSACIVYRS